MIRVSIPCTDLNVLIKTNTHIWDLINKALLSYWFGKILSGCLQNCVLSQEGSVRIHNRVQATFNT